MCFFTDLPSSTVQVDKLARLLKLARWRLRQCPSIMILTSLVVAVRQESAHEVDGIILSENILSRLHLLLVAMEGVWLHPHLWPLRQASSVGWIVMTEWCSYPRVTIIFPFRAIITPNGCFTVTGLSSMFKPCSRYWRLYKSLCFFQTCADERKAGLIHQTTDCFLSLKAPSFILLSLR